MRVRTGGEMPALGQVETPNVNRKAQAHLDREYVRFLEAKLARIERLCAQASHWLNLAETSTSAVSMAQKLLSEAKDRSNELQPS